MHHCLEVPEILDLIFSYVSPDPPGPSTRKYLLSSALTCRTFAEVALDQMWHTQTSLVPFFKTLPRDQWKEDPETGFDRRFAVCDPSEKDVARLEFYSRRIRRIKYLPYAWHLELYEGTAYDLIALRRLWVAREDKSKAVFPSLFRLEFIDPRYAYPCLDIFLESKSIALSLHWSESSRTLERLYPVIKKHALNMQELDLGSFQYFEGTQCLDLSRLVCQMSDLRGLSCGSRMLDSMAIQHLMSLPRLRKLQIPNTSQDFLKAINTLPKDVEAPFPGLQHLIMREDDLSSLKSLLRHMRPLEIQTLTLYCVHIPKANDVHSALLALQSGSANSNNLREISLKHIWPMENITSRRSTADVVINGATVEPLLSFRNLTVLTLDLPCVFDFGDFEINNMADAWPRLRHFQLGPMHGWGLPSSVSFQGLLTLLLRCPELSHLGLPFDATRGAPAISTISPAHVNKNITYLQVGNADVPGLGDIDALLGVAKFMAHVFPNLTGVGGEWMYDQDVDLERSRKAWDAILMLRKDWLNAGTLGGALC